MRASLAERSEKDSWKGTNRNATVSQPPVKRRLALVFRWIGGVLILLLTAATTLQYVLSQVTLDNSPVPGRLVDVDGRLAHLLCQGEGEPTVILEAGLPGGSLSWESVTPDLAEFTTVCTYDRAGYGWSEEALSPRTSKRIVGELRTLLQQARIAPPYILVGHSFGGLIVQLYGSLFASETAGMVLVDSSHSDQLYRTEDLDSMETVSFGIRALARFGVQRLFLPVPAGSPASRDASVRLMERDLLMTTRSLRSMASELAALRESLHEVAAHPLDLGHKPLVVLTEGRRRADFWHELQESLTAMSAESDWSIADNSGHFIHHDQPDLVVNAIRRVVEQTRIEHSSDHRHADSVPHSETPGSLKDEAARAQQDRR